MAYTLSHAKTPESVQDGVIQITTNTKSLGIRNTHLIETNI